MCTTSGVYLEPYQTSMMQKCSVIDIWQSSKYVSATSFSDIFLLYSFGYLNEYCIWTFCLSSESVQLLCSCDVNQKHKILSCFPNHFRYIDHGNTKFSYIYTAEMRKKLTLKNFKMESRLIYAINKNNNKNNKNEDRITKAFEKFLLSETILFII